MQGECGASSTPANLCSMTAGTSALPPGACLTWKGWQQPAVFTKNEGMVSSLQRTPQRRPAIARQVRATRRPARPTAPQVRVRPFWPLLCPAHAPSFRLVCNTVSVLCFVATRPFDLDVEFLPCHLIYMSVMLTMHEAVVSCSFAHCVLIVLCMLGCSIQSHQSFLQPDESQLQSNEPHVQPHQPYLLPNKPQCVSSFPGELAL